MSESPACGGRAPVVGADDQVGAAFARSFLETVVTAERAAEIVAGIVGPVVRFGPVPVGPHAMATATAEGRLGQVRGHRRLDAGALVVTVAVALRIAVRLGEKTLPAQADLLVRVRLRPRLVATPALAVDVDPIEDRDVAVETYTNGVSGVFLRRLGNLDDEIRTHARDYVADLLDTGPARAARHIDILAVVDRAWDHGLVVTAQT